MIQFLRVRSILFVVGLSLACWFVLRQCNSGRISEAFVDVDAGIRDNIEAQNYILEERFLTLENETSRYRNELNEHYYNGFLQLLIKHQSYQHFLDSLRVQIATATGVTLKSSKIVPLGKQYPSVNKLLPGMLMHISARTDSLYSDMLQLADQNKEVEACIYQKYRTNPMYDYPFHGEKGNFRDIPTTGTLAMISHLQSMALERMILVLNYCIKKTSGFDCFIAWIQPEANPQSPYVLSGDVYRADIFFTRYFEQLDEKSLQFFIDHKPMDVKDGISHFEQLACEVGAHSFVVEIKGKVWREGKSGRHYLDTFQVARTFAYQVVPFFPQVKLSNSPSFLYAYVDNPVIVSSAENSKSNEVQILSSNASLRTTEKGRYSVVPLSLDAVTLQTGSAVKFKFPVRPLPDPIASLALPSSTLTPTELAAQTSLHARFPEDFEVETDCTVLDFHVTRFRQREDPEKIENQGNTFSEKTSQLLKTAIPGDRFVFDEIQVQCGQEPAPRTIAGLSIRVQ